MKLLLVYPRTKYPSGDIPIGLSILCALATEAGHKVELFDASFRKEPFEDFSKLLKKSHFDTVGFSVMTTTARAASQMAGEVKKILPEATIIAGGPHATVMPEKTISDLQAHICFLSESETSFKKYLNGATVEELPGVCYLKDGKLCSGTPQELIDNLDAIPFPDISRFDVDKYIANWFSMDGVSVKSRGVNIMATRGCPFKCSFCQPTLSKMFGKKIRKHSPDYIVKMLEKLRSKYHINSFMFEDDTFTADRNWCLSVCDAISRAELDVYWGCNTHVNTIDAELLSEMKNAGLRKVYMGIESANQRVLDDVYGKGFRLHEAEQKIYAASQLGIKTHAYFIIGAPTETEQEIGNTIKFAAGALLDEASFSICTPLPGTALYEKYSNDIVADVEDMDYYSKPVFREGTSLPAEKLRTLRKKALLTFYFRGHRISSIIADMITPCGFRKFILKLKRV